MTINCEELFMLDTVYLLSVYIYLCYIRTLFDNRYLTDIFFPVFTALNKAWCVDHFACFVCDQKMSQK